MRLKWGTTICNIESCNILKLKTCFDHQIRRYCKKEQEKKSLPETSYNNKKSIPITVCTIQ